MTLLLSLLAQTNMVEPVQAVALKLKPQCRR